MTPEETYVLEVIEHNPLGVSEEYLGFTSVTHFNLMSPYVGDMSEPDPSVPSLAKQSQNLIAQVLPKLEKAGLIVWDRPNRVCYPIPKQERTHAVEDT